MKNFAEKFSSRFPPFHHTPRVGYFHVVGENSYLSPWPAISGHGYLGSFREINPSSQQLFSSQMPPSPSSCWVFRLPELYRRLSTTRLVYENENPLRESFSLIGAQFSFRSWNINNEQKNNPLRIARRSNFRHVL